MLPHPPPPALLASACSREGAGIAEGLALLIQGTVVAIGVVVIVAVVSAVVAGRGLVAHVGERLDVGVGRRVGRGIDGALADGLEPTPDRQGDREGSDDQAELPSTHEEGL